ncbi:MAG: hypothetical protein EOO51_13310 [Flavobacterium sp.]|nr:MAG: hypothetical protein EOO51_13310 [Flavobacterium sp.]
MKPNRLFNIFLCAIGFFAVSASYAQQDFPVSGFYIPLSDRLDSLDLYRQNSFLDAPICFGKSNLNPSYFDDEMQPSIFDAYAVTDRRKTMATDESLKFVNADIKTIRNERRCLIVYDRSKK